MPRVNNVNERKNKNKNKSKREKEQGCLIAKTIENGYETVILDGKKFFVHDLVADAFLPPKEDGQVLVHINGDTTDNRAVNLKWVFKETEVNKVNEEKILKAIFNYLR